MVRNVHSLVGLFAIAVAAHPAVALQQVATIPTTGSAYEVKAVGSLAYVADGTGGLRIFDVSIPAAPALVGALPALPTGTARSLDLVGTRAYVANGGPGIQIVDVSNPAAPIQLGSFDTPGSVLLVRAAGNLAYVGGTFSLDVYDVVNPAAAVKIGTLAGSAFETMERAGTLLVASTITSPVFRVIDVSNPNAPVLVAGRDDLRGALDVVGNRVWVAKDGSAGGDEVAIVDLANPASPTVFRFGTPLPNPTLPGNGVPIAVRGGLLFAGGVALADVHAAGAPGPLVLGQLSFPYSVTQWAEDVEVVGPHAFVTTEDLGGSGAGSLEIVDVSNAASPTPVSSLPLGRSLGLDVARIGGVTYAFVASGLAALSIVDVSAPTAPAVVGQTAIAGVLDVDVVGTTAFVVDTTCTLSAIDVSSPSAPALRDQLATAGGSTGGVAVANGVAWLACNNGTPGIVDAIDVSDPDHLAFLHSFSLDAARSVRLDGDLLYVTTSDGLFVYNVADPQSPVPVGSLLGVAGLRFDLFKRFSYMPQLAIVDVHDPSAPQLVNFGTSLNTAARGIRVVGGRAYTAGSSGLQIHDVSVPGEPASTEIAAVVASGNATSIAVDAATGIALTAFGTGGVRVYDASAEIATHPCLDGVDNDGDAQIDIGQDAGCTAGDDPSERPTCSDGLDNDGDGLTDFPADPGCATAQAAKEDPQCQDGVDNEGDGGVDFPADPLCKSARDDDELSNGGCGLLGIEPVAALAIAQLVRRRARRRA